MNGLVELNFTDLGLALLIIGFCLLLSRLSGLNLEGRLIIATGRSILQLLVVGYLIALIFSIDNPIVVLFVLTLMIAVAAITAKNRIDSRNKQLLLPVFLSLAVSSSLTLGYVIIFIIQPDRWYSPQYLIPLMGMVLGNAMNGGSLAGERLTRSIEQNLLTVETHLCLGATPRQSIDFYRKEAVRASLIPTINQMSIVGLVSLPGMFTGQVLAGGEPLNAASYQILILFMIAFANLTTALLVTEAVYRHFFNTASALK